MEEDEKHNFILSKSGLNSLDYFLLIKEISKLLNKNYNDKKLEDKLKKLKNNSYYPLYRCYIDINKEKNLKVRFLMELMDYAVAGKFNSFENLEKNCSFYKNNENNELSQLEEQYIKIGEIEEKYYSLFNKYELLSNELKKNKKRK